MKYVCMELIARNTVRIFEQVTRKFTAGLIAGKQGNGE